MTHVNWKREELIIAFNLYCRLGFTKIKYTHPEIIKIADLLGRTPSAVAFKLVNFASLDPELKQRGVTGMGHGSKSDEIIWNEFNNNREELIFESEKLIASKENIQLERKYSNILPDISNLTGEEKIREIKTRINQQVFRSMILSIYQNKCAITGINISSLLIASHIIPWSEDEKNRMNPANGLCLNALHDKAFDKGLITITPDYVVLLSDLLLENIRKTQSDIFFLPYKDKKVLLPQKFLPSREFLEYHNSKIFKI